MSKPGKLLGVLALLMFLPKTPVLRADDPPKSDETKRKELERFQGTWQLVHAETEGKPAPAEAVAKTRVTIEGSTHTVRFGDDVVVHAVPFVFDPTTTPPSTEDTVKTADGEHKIRGIYRLVGNVLVSCVGPSDGDRPTEFRAPAGSGRTLRVFRRRGSDAQEAAVAAELARFAGTWMAERMEMKGRTITAPDLPKVKLEIEKNGHFVSTEAAGAMPGVFIVNPETAPSPIDIVLLGGPPSGSVIPGVYRLEGDTLTECVSPGSSERPKGLTSPTASDSHVLQVLKRQP